MSEKCHNKNINDNNLTILDLSSYRRRQKEGEELHQNTRLVNADVNLQHH